MAAQTWPVTLYQTPEPQTWPVTLWDGQPPSEGYLWYQVDVTAIDAWTRPFTAPADATQTFAPIDLAAAFAPVDITATQAPLDVTNTLAPLDMEQEAD